ncbi:MAG: polysaccharide biosynthesis C-terminal domain-containing protein [Lewinellaceae bacterium]|nr:polysaccharide biosynthesis C-terminal domain-containing protein [Saprospiraceae bacterium]MCB9338283.1 polysaccharide biosynthesis C-terminal domain-containing protein [Lewinellaceae bacterium]
MNREFLLNAIFLILVNVLIKPFYVFGIERKIQDTVGAETYGLYATLFSFSFLLFMLNDFGIHYFNNRNIARHPQLVGKYFPNILALKFLLTAVYLVAVFVAALIRGFEMEIFYLLFFIALNHVLISMVAYLRSNISGLGMYRTDSLVSTLDKVLLIGICAVLLWGPLQGANGGFQIEWFVHAQNASWLLTALVAFFIVKKNIRQKLVIRFRRPFLVAVLKKSAPYALAVFLMTAYTRFDIVVLEWILPDGRHEAGVYAAGYRLLDALNMVGYLFAGLLLPMFSTLLKKQEKNEADASEITSLLRLSLEVIWAGTATVAIACFFFRGELMHWLYPETATAYYGDVLAFIILTLVPFSGIFIYSTLLTANNSLKKMNWLFGSGIVVNLALNLLLIPAYKAVGAGCSAFATQTFVLVGMMFLAKKELHLAMDWRQASKIASFILLVIIANWLLFYFSQADWLLRFTAALAIGLLLAIALRLLRIKMLLGLVKH